MKAFTAPLLELAEFDTIQKTKYREPGMIQIAGSTGSQKGHLAYALAREDRRVLYVVQDEEKAKEILLEKEIDILVDLKDGSFDAEAYGCDLTYDYVKINGDYRT